VIFKMPNHINIVKVCLFFQSLVKVKSECCDTDDIHRNRSFVFRRTENLRINSLYRCLGKYIMFYTYCYIYNLKRALPNLRCGYIYIHIYTDHILWWYIYIYIIQRTNCTMQRGGMGWGCASGMRQREINMAAGR